MAGFNTLKARQKNITISNRSGLRLPFSQGGIKRRVLKIFKLLKKELKGRPVGVIFLNDKEIKRLNRKYLKHNRTTDVLAFDYRSLGLELAISLDTAKRNAKIYNTSVKEEIILYIIHGILHLSGYSDAALAAKRRMFKKQDQLMKLVSN